MLILDPFLWIRIFFGIRIQRAKMLRIHRIRILNCHAPPYLNCASGSWRLSWRFCLRCSFSRSTSGSGKQERSSVWYFSRGDSVDGASISNIWTYKILFIICIRETLRKILQLQISSSPTKSLKSSLDCLADWTIQHISDQNLTAYKLKLHSHTWHFKLSFQDLIF